MKRFERFEHTADIGVRTYGRTLKELFKNSAISLSDILTDLKKVKAKLTRKISLKASNSEELLVNFLSELLYLYNIKEFLVKDVNIEKLEDKLLECEIKGELIDKKRHILKSEVKGVTYCNFKIEKKKNFYVAEMIFDV